MQELLRPPTHRGPLIAAGAVVLTTGVALQQIRLADSLDAGWHTLIAALVGALLLWLGIQETTEGGRPRAHQSVLLVCGLLLLYVALLRVADLLGASFEDEFPAGAFVWTGIVEAAVAGLVASRRDSAIAGFISAVAAAVAVLSFVDWVFELEDVASIRWFLLAIAIGLVVVSLLLRAPRPRHSEMLVAGAGLAILAIPLTSIGTLFFGVFVQEFGPPELLPGWWEFVVLAAGFGLIAYSAADRAPGPGWLGLANLLAFILVTTFGEEESLEWWPLTLLGVGALMLGAGLRPRRPLPPEPVAYRAGEVPLTARVEGDETVFEVKQD